jgi:RNA polymerase sigma-54 factor
MKIQQQVGMKQNLSLSASMQESLKVLQLTATDLLPYLNNIIESNPFLEIENFDTENDKISSENNDFIDDNFSKAIYDQIDGHYVIKPYYQDGINNLDTEKKTLKSHIKEQIQYLDLDVDEKFIALYITDYLNSDGYLIDDLSFFSDLLNCKLAKIKDILHILQSLDPIGVFARNLSECLAIQLKSKNLYSQEIDKIIENLNLLTQLNITELSKKINLDIKIIQDNLRLIRSLNPKPGNIFAEENEQIIIPDIILKLENGLFSLEVNNNFLPPVILNDEFYNKIKNSSLKTDKEQKNFATNYYKQGKSVLDAISERNNTLYKVSSLIIKKQQDFFKKGVQYLNALKLEDISKELDLNISTISRVVSNKYLACHLGVFKLKYFFVNKAPNASDENDSSQKIKLIIKKIISEESFNNILSDNDIVEILKEHAILISRRTVAKYRAELGISNVSIRKRQLQNS